MGNVVPKLWSGGDHDRPDPITGLSKRDITNIRRSWAPIWANAEGYGLEIFKRFFCADADIKTLFKFLKNVTDDQLPTTPQFQAHVINFMSTLNMLIENLHKPDVATAITHKIGENHKRHGVPKKHFDTLDGVLANFLIKDQKLSPRTVASWTKLIDFMNPHIFKTLLIN